ncbi:dirigent protein 23 [Phtheirospermum japonicum]|uniref:Dirigent protein n=1 Tax=Phtheirospermum japonicum TaxID=374723 RepID=A0A830B1F3_9LAMI|nr:dirigent protein 23 [Phtheirospermum japonicum]
MIIIALLLLPSAAYAKPKVTRLHFFLQDTFSGPNASVYPVAQSEITSNSSTSFGLVCVVDDPLTVDPNPNSELVGRAQGTVAYADLNEQAIHVSLTFVFTSGEYNGSTLTMVGRNSLSHQYRRMPIVGGTGAFELAQGIATTRTYSTRPQIDHSTAEFNITVAQMYRLFG